MPNILSILVLGAGELGIAVLRSFARRAEQLPNMTLTVLLRHSTITSNDPIKKRDMVELGALGIKFLQGDLESSAEELSALFKGYHTVIGCTGFVAGRSIQLKLAQAVLKAGVHRYFPWQFGVDYEVIGRGQRTGPIR